MAKVKNTDDHISENRKRERMNDEDDRTVLEDILDFVKIFALSAIVILLFVNFIAQPVSVVGHSMDPTLSNGEFGFTGIIQNFFREIERGDIVVLKMEDENGTQSHWVKRVIGMPGETIEAKNGVVYINGEPLDESAYLNAEFMQKELDAINASLKDENANKGFEYGTFQDDFGPVTLNSDQYFVIGDNRPNSKDSRHPSVGPVTRDQIFGTGIMVLYPFNQFGVK